MISEKIRSVQGMEGARRATGIPCTEAVQGVRCMPSLPVNPTCLTTRYSDIYYYRITLKANVFCRTVELT